MKLFSRSDESLKGGGAKTVLPLALAIIFLGLAVYAFYYPIAKRDENRQRLRAVAKIQVQMPQLIGAAQSAVNNGDAQGFDQIASIRNQINRSLQMLASGNSSGLPPMPEILRPQLAQLDTQWRKMETEVDEILRQRQSVSKVIQYSKTVNELLPQLLNLSDSFVKSLLAEKASSHVIYLAERQASLTLLIEADLSRFLTGSGNLKSSIKSFETDTNRFGTVLQGFLTGDAKLGLTPVTQPRDRAILRQEAMLFSALRDGVKAILELAPKYGTAREDLAKLPNAATGVLVSARALSNQTLAYGQGLRRYTYAGFGLVLLSVLMLFFLGWNIYSQNKRELALASEQNKRNQRAILRLLDEMTNLAEGDLSFHATVSEDITGAIADAVNYAIDALRSLVATINQTSVRVATASEKTQATALRLADASNHQAREIEAASAAITEMSDSVEHVATDAMEASEVAKQSVDIAHKGAETVRRSIDGMETLREQIQDTSKRIKRLGESSQEIGEIVGLINDIADQTNILALNAAIQASAAGEAGRGFAVVADEVQRLAERSANATRQIDALVKTIQADTNEAIHSMEISTSNVVAGGELANEAGTSLAEIEKASDQLAQKIIAIASAARQQVAVAGNVVNTMSVIQEITAQTSEGTDEVARSIGQLASLAAELRTTVAGFKLPDSEDENTFIIEHEAQNNAA